MAYNCLAIRKGLEHFGSSKNIPPVLVGLSLLHSQIVKSICLQRCERMWIDCAFSFLSPPRLSVHSTISSTICSQERRFWQLWRDAICDVLLPALRNGSAMTLLWIGNIAQLHGALDIWLGLLSRTMDLDNDNTFRFCVPKTGVAYLTPWRLRDRVHVQVAHNGTSVTEGAFSGYVL